MGNLVCFGDGVRVSLVLFGGFFYLSLLLQGFDEMDFWGLGRGALVD